MTERIVLLVGKAQPAYKGQYAPDVQIDIAAPLPDYSLSLTLAARYYDQQARQIEEVLHQSLPGGTYDRLAGHMLARKASHFRVPHAEPKQAPDA